MLTKSQAADQGPDLARIDGREAMLAWTTCG